MCFACGWVGRRLGRALAPVFPVRLCPLPSPLYSVLLGYKEAPVSEARARFVPMVRQIAVCFVGGHAACLASAARGAFDLVCAVPSSARPSGSPLEAVDGLGRRGGVPDRRALAARTSRTGSLPGGSHAARTPTPTRCRRTPHRSCEAGASLLLDDTYVSGARAQSAAAALRAGGAEAVVILALGRVLRPDRSPRQPAFLRANSRSPGTGNAVAARAVLPLPSGGGAHRVAHAGQLLGGAPQGRCGGLVTGPARGPDESWRPVELKQMRRPHVLAGVHGRRRRGTQDR